MEDRLRASEGATSAKDRALATLAHDIRSPLGAIEGYCELLEDEIYGPINDRQREALGRVRMSGRHLLSLLDNVMDMARLNAGVVRVEAEPVRAGGGRARGGAHADPRRRREAADAAAGRGWPP